MGWQCRLYGHHWHHPGEHEVFLAEGAVPAYPFECAVCGTEMLMDASGTARRSDARDRRSTGTGPELDFDFGPELDDEDDRLDA